MGETSMSDDNLVGSDCTTTSILVHMPTCVASTFSKKKKKERKKFDGDS